MCKGAEIRDFRTCLGTSTLICLNTKTIYNTFTGNRVTNSSMFGIRDPFEATVIQNFTLTQKFLSTHLKVKMRTHFHSNTHFFHYF